MKRLIKSIGIVLLCTLFTWTSLRLAQAITASTSYSRINYQKQHWDITLEAWRSSVITDLNSICTSVTALGTTVANWVTTVQTPVLIETTPIFVNDHQFTLTGDYTSVLTVGKRILADNGQDPAVGNTVLTSTYAAPNTTVTLTYNNLTANLQAVSYYATRSGTLTYGSGDILTSEYGSPSWANLQAAVSVANTSGRRLILTSGTWPVSDDLVITAPVYVTPVGIFQVATTKTLTLSGPFEAGHYQTFSLSGTGVVHFGAVAPAVYPIWFGTDYDALVAAKACIGSDEKTLDISGLAAWPVTTNLTLNPNVTLRNTPGSVLTIATGVKLTHLGPLDQPAALWAMFDCQGTGVVAFGDGTHPSRVPETTPERFGAAGDGTTDDIIPLKKAMYAVKGHLKLHGNYYITKPWHLWYNTLLVGSSARINEGQIRFGADFVGNTVVDNDITDADSDLPTPINYGVSGTSDGGRNYNNHASVRDLSIRGTDLTNVNLEILKLWALSELEEVKGYSLILTDCSVKSGLLVKGGPIIVENINVCYPSGTVIFNGKAMWIDFAVGGRLDTVNLLAGSSCLNSPLFINAGGLYTDIRNIQIEAVPLNGFVGFKMYITNAGYISAKNIRINNPSAGTTATTYMAIDASGANATNDYRLENIMFTCANPNTYDPPTHADDIYLQIIHPGPETINYNQTLLGGVATKLASMTKSEEIWCGTDVIRNRGTVRYESGSRQFNVVGTTGYFIVPQSSFLKERTYISGNHQQAIGFDLMIMGSTSVAACAGGRFYVMTTPNNITVTEIENSWGWVVTYDNTAKGLKILNGNATAVENVSYNCVQTGIFHKWD